MKATGIVRRIEARVIITQASMRRTIPDAFIYEFSKLHCRRGVSSPPAKQDKT